MSSADERTLLQKLIARAADPATTPSERAICNEHIRIIKANDQSEAAHKLYDADFAERHGFTIRPAANPMRPNAGWQAKNRHESDSGELRKRDYKAPPRYQRGVNRDAWINMQNEARARVEYENEYLLGLFGLKAGDVTTAETNRKRLRTFISGDDGSIKDVYIIDNVCLLNAKLTKRLLFWSHNEQRKYWFIVERDCITGKTQRSKRYFSREGALLAHTSDQITWQRMEYT
jgi:hypothetical protein